MAFHLYRINELYSSPSGSIQFVELTVGNANGESSWAGVTLATTRDGVTRSFTFPANLPSTSTANTTVLVATQSFAALGIVTPDYVVPDGFLFTAGGTLDFGGADIVTYAALPADGRSSVSRTGAVATATPRNFAAASGTLTPMPTISGTAGDDTLAGTPASELIEGLAGNDTLRSGGGNDTLWGQAGDDNLFSGTGNDTLDGGDGYDHLYFSEAPGGVTIDLRTGRTSGAAGADTIRGIELIFGSAFADTFVGGSDPVGFLGGDGDDTITGGPGDEHLEGNGGNDVIDGGGGVDRVAYYSAAGPVVVDLTAGTATGGLGNDTLRNVENVTGSVFGDTLTGNAADNRLEGSDGDDRFFATAGSDWLDGGDGLDTAVYPLARSAYTLNVRPPTAAAITWIEKPNAEGADTLPGIERLRFADRGVALDLDGNAGQVARLLGVVFGAGAVAQPLFVGIGLQLLDGGMAFEALAAAAVGVTGRTSHFDVVSLLWTNLAGTAPTVQQAAPFVALLDGGLSVGALTAAAANADLTANLVDLVGLTQSGIEYGL